MLWLLEDTGTIIHSIAVIDRNSPTSSRQEWGSAIPFGFWETIALLNT